MRARLVVRIAPTDVGRRISARTRLTGVGEPTTTDTLGYLRSWADGVLVVERRDGAKVELHEVDLLAARVVPGPPPRRRSQRVEEAP